MHERVFRWLPSRQSGGPYADLFAIAGCAVAYTDVSLRHSIVAAFGYTASTRQQATTTADPPTVFFSYARADAAIVRLFAQELRSAGIQVLLDTEFLRPGERFENTILDNVRSADALVFFVSPSSLLSKWVEAELLAFGKESNKVIFPVVAIQLE